MARTERTEYRCRHISRNPEKLSDEEVEEGPGFG